MLREIRNEHLEPMLLGLVVDLAGSQAITVGDDDISSFTDGGVGVQSHIFRQAFNRNPIAVATCTTVGGNGNLPAVSIIGPTSAQVSNVSNAGGGNDGTMHVLYLGWRARSTDLVRGQVMHGSINAPRMFGATITSAGAVDTGKGDVSCVKGTTGIYTVTFTQAFAKPPIVMITANDAALTLMPNIASVSATTVVVHIFNQVGSVADAAFELLVYGSGSRDEIGRQKKIVFNTQRKPRLIGVQVTVTAGTPAVSIGTNDIASIVDNGVGDYTLTLARPFRRAPTVIATSGQGSKTCRVISRTASTIRVAGYTDSGAASDPDNLYIFALGSDDPSEY